MSDPRKDKCRPERLTRIGTDVSCFCRLDEHVREGYTLHDVVAVDLGNTEAKFGYVSDGRLVAMSRIPTASVSRVRDGAALVAAADGLADVIGGCRTASGHVDVVLGSVVSWAGARIAALMVDLGCRVTPMTSLQGFGFRINYEYGEPGVDRVAACCEAFARSGGPLILLGLGTAVHTNAVSADGVYLGGAIMPGLRLLSESLGAGTDHVAPVDPDLPLKVIGNSTPEGARIGVFQAWLGGALRLIDLTREEIGGEPHLWLTGGHSAWVEPYVPGAKVASDLALLGLARAFHRIDGHA